MDPVSSVTWPCHGCGEWREDEWISVAHCKVPSSALKQTVQLNARYCNDRTPCLHKVADLLEDWACKLVNAQAEPAVHVLFEGLVLCGRLRGYPKDWPTGQHWVRLEEVGEATCDACRIRAKQPL